MNKTYDEVVDEMAMQLGTALNLSTWDTVMVALSKTPPPEYFAILPVARTIAFMFDMRSGEVYEDLGRRINAYIEYLRSEK